METQIYNQKGKAVGSIVINELKYKSFIFYFITDGFKVKMLSERELNDLLIKFVRKRERGG